MQTVTENTPAAIKLQQGRQDQGGGVHASVGHAEHDRLHPLVCGAVDERLHAGDERLGSPPRPKRLAAVYLLARKLSNISLQARRSRMWSCLSGVYLNCSKQGLL